MTSGAHYTSINGSSYPVHDTFIVALRSVLLPPYPTTAPKQLQGLQSVPYIPTNRRVRLTTGLVLRHNNAIFIQIKQLQTRLSHHFSKRQPNKRQRYRLYPGTLQYTKRRNGLPTRLTTVPTTRRRPHLHASRGTTTIFRPTLPFQRTTTIILSNRTSILPNLPRTRLSIPTKYNNARNIQGRIRTSLFNRFPITPSGTLLRPTTICNRLHTTLNISLTTRPFRLHRRTTRIRQPLLRQFLQDQGLRRLPRHPFRPNYFLLRILRHLNHTNVLRQLWIRLWVFPILFRRTR